MKGLLAGTNKFPGVVVMRKRRRGGVHVDPRKKSRKLQEQQQTLAKENGDAVRSDADYEVLSGAGIGAELATEGEGGGAVPVAKQQTET